MADAFDHRLPSFGRVRDYLVHEELHTSTLSVYVFMVALPAAIFVGDLLLEIFRRKAGTPVSEIIGNTLWPTVVSALITLTVWTILLGWSFIKLVARDKNILIGKIAEKDTYIQQLGEIMGQRAEESATRINQDAVKLYDLQEKIRQIKDQLSLTEKQLYDARTQLANERDCISQPDVALIWDWPESQREHKTLMGYSDKLIMVDNRSEQFVYNIQIDPLKLHQELSFETINEIAPGKQHIVEGHWNGRSTLTTDYAYFFTNEDNEKEMSGKGWLLEKIHNRGMTPFFLRIPMALTYEAKGIKWRIEVEFTYDVGDESSFAKKSGQRLN